MFMKKLLSGLLVLGSFSAFSSETICIAKAYSEASYFISSKEYRIQCNDGQTYKAGREVRILYIPNGDAEKMLASFMKNKDLKQVATIERTYPTDSAGWTSTTDQILVFSNKENKNSEWAYVQRYKKMQAGPNKVNLYHFSVTFDNLDKINHHDGYTEEEFSDFFEDLYYTKSIEGKISPKSSHTNYLYKKTN